MLYIITQTNKESTWHIGEPFPAVTGRVITFQADGDELELILNALRGRQDIIDGTWQYTKDGTIRLLTNPK